MYHIHGRTIKHVKVRTIKHVKVTVSIYLGQQSWLSIFLNSAQEGPDMYIRDLLNF